MTDKIKQNICPRCNAPLLLYRSLFKKQCVDCRTEYEWNLKDKQPPLIKYQR